MKGSRAKLFLDELRLFISTTRKFNRQIKISWIIYHLKLTYLDLAQISGNHCTKMGIGHERLQTHKAEGEVGPSEAHMFLIRLCGSVETRG